MANNDDFAIVVGIGRYSRFSQPLQSPDNDASEIYNWLVDSEKGGFVPPSNIDLIKSSDYPAPESDDVADRPMVRDISDAFTNLISKSQEGRVGRRIYFYFSGHGFGNKINEGGLITADADSLKLEHFFVSSWISWVINAALFDECLLWFDACMATSRIIAPQPCNLRVMNSRRRSEIKIFEGFSARFPAKSTEREFSPGKWQSVFTYTLLNGLYGGAANPQTGNVSTDSLREFLNNTMHTNIPVADANDPDISRNPSIGVCDPFIITQIASPEMILNVAPKYIGQKIEVKDLNLDIIHSETISNTRLRVRAGLGAYQILIGDSQRLLENTGMELNIA